jgi:hypothetical protein
LQGDLQPHALAFDSGSELGSELGSAPGSGAATPRSRTPSPRAQQQQQQHPAGPGTPALAGDSGRQPLIGGSTATSTNPAFHRRAPLILIRRACIF